MGLRCSQTVPAVVLIVVAVVGILLLVLPAKEMALPPENMVNIILDAIYILNPYEIIIIIITNYLSYYVLRKLVSFVRNKRFG